MVSMIKDPYRTGLICLVVQIYGFTNGAVKKINSTKNLKFIPCIEGLNIGNNIVEFDSISTVLTYLPLLAKKNIPFKLKGSLLPIGVLPIGTVISHIDFTYCKAGGTQGVVLRTSLSTMN